MLEEFNSELQTIEVIITESLNYSGSSEGLLEAMKYTYFDGGKRIRPLLMLLCADGLGLDRKYIEPFIVGIEMIHSYSLIHDDLPAMDNDDFRRGKQSNHKAFGEATAILAGDGLLNTAFEHICKSLLTWDTTHLTRGVKALHYLALQSGISGMVDGQIIDTTYDLESMGIEQLKEMIIKKTVALIRASIVIPAILNDCNVKDIEELDNFALNLGLAFQIKDDILDYEEDRELKKATYATILGKEKAEQKVVELSDKSSRALQNIDNYQLDRLKELMIELVHRKY